jgi:hypothetical protein
MSAPMSAEGAKRPNRPPSYLAAARSERVVSGARVADDSIRSGTRGLAGRPAEGAKRPNRPPSGQPA